MSIPPDTRMSNAQVALICATDLDPGAYRVPDGDARTDRVIARAHQFLAFLEEADQGTRPTDPQERHDKAVRGVLDQARQRALVTTEAQESP